MKKIILIILLFVVNISFAQSPEKVSFQAVIRNSSDELITESAVGMRISINQGTFDGITVYSENHSLMSNINGLITLQIGNGNVMTGAFSSINWSNGPYFIKTETDPDGGSNYTIIGTSQILSVPYALHANTADSVTNDQINDGDTLIGNEFNESVLLNGNMLETTDQGGTIYTDLSSLQDGVNDNDADSTNELQSITISNDTIFLSDGGEIKLPTSSPVVLSDENGIDWTISVDTNGQLIT